MENLKTTITWNEGVEIAKEQKKKEIKHNEEYNEQLDDAYDEFEDRLQSENFRGWSELEDAAQMHGVEPDDLINMFL